ncbi:MAG: tetratricopeptide repeat protein [bacterium]|nr:tetratricopeptide repeat protein [bacterium]
MYCQVCGTGNPVEEEYCRRCQQKLMVVSGASAIEDQETFDSNPEEQFSFDEHLLERISILEEVVKRTAETTRYALGSLYKLEQKILVNQTGITTLRDLLESKRVIAREEWSELWESRMDRQLLALEKRERFAAVKEEIAALYRGDGRNEFRQLLEEAEYSLLAFEIEDAMRILVEAHELDPDNHELSFFLGETFFNEGRSDAALRYFGRVLAIKPNHFESLVYSGVLHHEHRDAGGAEELLKRAVALYPDAFLPAFSLGAVYAAGGHLAQAVVFLERAAAADPIPQAFFLLGSCCYEMGRVTAAIRHLRETVRQDPASEEAHHLLGLAYLDRRWYRKALTAFREAQRLNPNRLRYHELMRLLAEPGGAEPAHGRSLPEVEGEAASLVRRAEESLHGGQSRQALSSYRQALSHDPDNPTLLVAYAMACLELGRAQEIESVVDKVIGLDPGDRLRATAYATLIEALRSEGRYREGNRVGRLLLSEGGSDFAKTVAYFEMAFNLAEIEEDLDDALSFARQSVELAPEELRQYPLAALGWVHYKRREFDQAVDCLTRSTELGTSSRTLTHLGMALLASGARERAREVLVRVRRLGEADGALQVKVLECLKDGARLLQDPARPLPS